MPSGRLDIEVTEMKKTLFLKLKVYQERKLQKQGTNLKGDKLSNRAGVKHCVSTEGRAICQQGRGWEPREVWGQLRRGRDISEHLDHEDG